MPLTNTLLIQKNKSGEDIRVDHDKFMIKYSAIINGDILIKMSNNRRILIDNLVIATDVSAQMANKLNTPGVCHSNK